MFAPPLASKTTNEQTAGGKLSAVDALVAIARVAAHWLEETKRGVRCKNSSANYSDIFTSVQLGFAMATIVGFCMREVRGEVGVLLLAAGRTPPTSPHSLMRFLGRPSGIWPPSQGHIPPPGIAGETIKHEKPKKHQGRIGRHQDKRHDNE